MVLEIPDRSAWDAKLEEAKAAGKIVVVDFTAVWCGPCRMIGPEFEKLSHDPEFANLVFLKVDVDKVESVAQACNIKAMPTFIVFKDGKPVEEIVGASKDKLLALLKKAAAGGPFTA